MRILAATVFMSLAAVTIATAQDRQDRWEIGLAVGGFGLVDDNFLFRIPGPGLQGSPGAFARIHTSDHLFLEPEIGFLYVEGDYSLEFGFGVGYRLTPENEDGTFYFAGNLGVARSSAGAFDNNDVAPGASAGYWIPLFDHSASASVEAGYRYWTDGEFGDFRLVLKVALMR